MTRIGFILINLLFFLTIGTSEAQSLIEDNNVIFIQANGLFNTDRYDEAVRLYNRILKDDPGFSRAIFMRGKAKFALGAFKGTKNDMLDYIDQRGVNQELIEILANAEQKLGNESSALSYYEVLHKLLPYEGKYFSSAAQIKYDSGDRNRACEYWIKAAKLGDPIGAKQASLKCAYDNTIHLSSKQRVQETEESKTSESTTSEEPGIDETIEVEEETRTVSDDEATISEEASNNTDIIDVSVHPVPAVNLNATQKIEIDDELTIVLNSGLGDRNVDHHPNILMLSDKSGKVVIKMCVGGDGNVISAELDDDRTTIFRSSLSSLAIRKAKEFVFMPSLSNRQCGLLIYDIDTGR